MDSFYFVQGMSRGIAWQQGHLSDHRLNQLVAKAPEVQAIMEQLCLGHGEGDVHRFTSVVHAAMQGSCFDEALDFLTSSGPQGALPDPDVAALAKEAGTLAFAAGRLDDALKSYTADSLLAVDETSPAGAALAAKVFCNRALCHLRLKPPSFAAAAADASCALEVDPGYAKAWFRRALAHEGLHRLDAARRDARQAVATARRHWLSSEDTRRPAKPAPSACSTEGAQAEAEQALQRIERVGQGKHSAVAVSEPAAAPEPLTDDVPRLNSVGAAEAPGPRHAVPSWLPLPAWRPACSGQPPGRPPPRSQAALSSSPALGRFAVAAAPLQAGRGVMSEMPYAGAIHKAFLHQRCATCGRIILPNTEVPCQACQACRYCSPECRCSDRFHAPGGVECCRIWPLVVPLELVLAVRVLRRQLEEQGTAADHVSSLEDHMADWLQQGHSAGLLQLAVMAVLVAAAASACGPPAAEGQTGFCAGDLLRLVLVVDINAVAVVEPPSPLLPAQQHERVGLGLYLGASMLNHSCVPNVAFNFAGMRLTVRAVHDMPAGQPLLHCYGPQRGEATTALRRRQLQESYHFECQCEACCNPAPAEATQIGLRCQSAGCKGAIVPDVSLGPQILSIMPLIPSQGQACHKCGAELDPAAWEATRAALEHCADKIEKAKQGLQQAAGRPGWGQGCGPTEHQRRADAEPLLAALAGVTQVYRRLLHPVNELVGVVASITADLHANVYGNPQAAAEASKNALRIMLKHYPSESPQVAHQRLELAMFLSRAGKLPDAARQFSQAKHVLELWYGPEYESELVATANPLAVY